VINTKKLFYLEPNDIELEKSVLYCLIYNKNIQYKILSIEEDDFYNKNNREIFLELKNIFKTKKEISPEIVSSKLKRKSEFVGVLTHTSVTSNFDIFFERFKEIADLRKMWKIAHEIAVKVQENKSSKEIRNNALAKIGEVRGLSNITFEKQTEEIDGKLEEMLTDSNLVSIMTGYPTLDRITRGFIRGSFNIIASAQGMGKSSFILNLINHICGRQGKSALFVSIELDYDILHGKMVSLISGINFQRLMFESSKLTEGEWKKINDARARIANYKLYRIGDDETTPLNIEDTLKEIKDIDIIFIDYLQLMKPIDNASTIRERITNLSSELKLLARKTGIPIVAISSINREYSKREDKEPRISDLRESGKLEYDAGLVLLIHRACKFRDANYSDGENPEEFEKEAELIVAKNRFGEDSLKIQYYFDGATGLFREMSKHKEVERVERYEEYRDLTEQKEINFEQ